MPTDDPSIGFSNKWYPAGFEHAVTHRFEEGGPVRILAAPYFIATKLEAFKSRGKNDGRSSHDFEDIVFVLENRKQVWKEFENCDQAIKEYLKSEFSILLNIPYISEWIDCHVER